MNAVRRVALEMLREGERYPLSCRGYQQYLLVSCLLHPMVSCMLLDRALRPKPLPYSGPQTKPVGETCTNQGFHAILALRWCYIADASPWTLTGVAGYTSFCHSTALPVVLPTPHTASGSSLCGTSVVAGAWAQVTAP